MTTPGHWQLPGEELDVASWPEDEEYPLFPEGSREKRLLHCPEPPPFAWLIGGHRYLFKQSRRIYPEQFWAEVVASRLGRITGVDVPPAYAAWNSRTGQCAALIEWFWGRPSSPPQGFLSGGMFMKDMIPDFDHVKGRQHNFGHIDALCHALDRTGRPHKRPRPSDRPWFLAWARILTFDALIGNTDRHQENWGFIWTRVGSPPRLEMKLGPAFDNGTSLGHEHPAEHFGRFEDDNYLRRYIARGHHHMRWRLDDPKPCGHIELLLKLVTKEPECRLVMLSVLRCTDDERESAIMPLTELRLPVPLTTERARFMLRLLKARRAHLLEALKAP